ncbi:MAG: hypothetical protein ACK4NF_05665, partial [Planctomycetota bacterium]
TCFNFFKNKLLRQGEGPCADSSIWSHAIEVGCSDSKRSVFVDNLMKEREKFKNLINSWGEGGRIFLENVKKFWEGRIILDDIKCK